MQKVAVVGVGQTKFGEKWEESLRDLGRDAGIAAIKDAKIEKKEIDGVWVGNMSGGRFAGQEHIGALIADHLGINAPATRCEVACASGSLAFRNACFAVAAGKMDMALVVGVEKMNDVKADDSTGILISAGDHEWEASIGLTFPGLYALMARAYMKKYGLSRDELSFVPVASHENGLNNENAQFRMKISIDDVNKSSLVADPLRLLDCSPITDGGAAVVIVSEKAANKFENLVWVLASGQGSDTLALHDRTSITEMQSVKTAAKQVFDECRLKHEDIDVIEAHDCFSINEIMNVEDTGFCEKGKGQKFIEENKKRINSTGGLKSIGHPVGATGVRQIIDIVNQIRGKSCNHVKGARYGLTMNVGGSGATAIAHVFGVEL